MSKRTNKENILIYVNQTSLNGFSAIHYACYKGDIRMINILIYYGADHNIITKKGLNILHLSSQSDKVNSLVLFVDKYNINPNFKDYSGSTPLHWASYSGSYFFVYFLLCKYLYSININEPDLQGLTPLHINVLNG